MDLLNIQSVIEGCLLGDGHLELGKRCTNSNLSYRSSSKKHVEFVHKQFINYCSNNYKTIKRTENYDKRTNKTYVSYYFRTKKDKIFTEQYKRFYIGNIKVVPIDLILNKINLLFWYIGDGSIQDYIKIHTDSFSETEVDFLCEKLSMFGAKKMKKQKFSYMVYIPRFFVKSFLNYIGDCPIEDYNHRWNITDYKYKKVEKDNVSDYSSFYKDIILDYNKNKNVSIYDLSKKFNVPIACITNYFSRNNVLWKRKNKKQILQYDMKFNLVKEWESGKKIKEELNFNQGAISECCRNKRKTYKNFIWKFKELN